MGYFGSFVRNIKFFLLDKSSGDEKFLTLFLGESSNKLLLVLHLLSFLKSFKLFYFYITLPRFD